MLCKKDVLRKFAKFTRKHLCQSLFLNKVASWDCKKDVLRNFAKFSGKHLCQSLFFNKVAGLKRDSGTGVFLWILQISKNTFSYRTPPVAAFESVAYILRPLSRKNRSESKKLCFYLIADWINFMYFHTALFIVLFETENAISFYYDFTYISEAVTGNVL